MILYNFKVALRNLIIDGVPYALRQLIGTTYMPSFLLYAGPVAVSIIMNEGLFFSAMSDLSLSKFLAPSSIRLSPPSLISIGAHLPSLKWWILYILKDNCP